MAGETIDVAGYPFTNTWDTLLSIDGLAQPVIDVSRTGCNDCDACRVENQCLACQDCDPCDSLCKNTTTDSSSDAGGECIEMLSFKMPNSEKTSVEMKIVNAYGHSDVINIEIATEEEPEDSAQ